MTDIILTTFVVYKSPADYPGKFVAREWTTHKDGSVKAGNIFAITTIYELLERQLEGLGLSKLMPMPGDDPCILETWI